MRFLITVLFFCLFFSLFAPHRAYSEDYFKKILVPEGAEDKTLQVYPAFDFEDVIFNRKYFYTMQEGVLQVRRMTVSPWKKVEVTVPGPEDMKEVAPVPEGE